jgi:hypothetical protein
LIAYQIFAEFQEDGDALKDAKEPALSFMINENNTNMDIA